MILIDLREKIRSRLMERTDIGPTQIDNWINYAQRQICERCNFDFMQMKETAQTIDNQRSYPWPENCKEERYTELINHENRRLRLYKYTKEQLNRKFKDVSVKGVPEYYCFSEQNILFYPLPDHSLNGASSWDIEFEYYGYLDDLINDDDETKLSKKHPYLIVGLAVSEAFNHIYEEEKARYYYELVMSDLKTICAQQLSTRLSENIVETRQK